MVDDDVTAALRAKPAVAHLGAFVSAEEFRAFGDFDVLRFEEGEAGDGRAAAVAHDQKPDWGPVWFCCNSTVYESALPGAEGSSLPAFRTRVRRRAVLGRSLPHIMFIETRAGLIEWEPDNAARTVAAVAVSRLVEGTDQLPFL